MHPCLHLPPSCPNSSMEVPLSTLGDLLGHVGKALERALASVFLWMSPRCCDTQVQPGPWDVPMEVLKAAGATLVLDSPRFAACLFFF